MASLTIVRKERSCPENYCNFFLSSKNSGKEIRVVLCDGSSIQCSRHRRATEINPCECMVTANAAYDKDEYWQAYQSDDDYSDLIDD